MWEGQKNQEKQLSTYKKLSKNQQNNQPIVHENQFSNFLTTEDTEFHRGRFKICFKNHHNPENLMKNDKLSYKNSV